MWVSTSPIGRHTHPKTRGANPVIFLDGFGSGLGLFRPPPQINDFLPRPGCRSNEPPPDNPRPGPEIGPIGLRTHPQTYQNRLHCLPPAGAQSWSSDFRCQHDVMLRIATKGWYSNVFVADRLPSNKTRNRTFSESKRPQSGLNPY